MGFAPLFKGDRLYRPLFAVNFCDTSVKDKLCPLSLSRFEKGLGDLPVTAPGIEKPPGARLPKSG